YVAGGGAIRSFRRHLPMDDVHSLQPGILSAIGYQGRLGSKVGGRVEVRWLSLRKSDSVVPSNQYALLLGLWRPVGGNETRATGPWRLQLGIAGGYIRTHIYGSFSGFDINLHETALEFVGSGSPISANIFVIVPSP